MTRDPYTPPELTPLPRPLPTRVMEQLARWGLVERRVTALPPEDPHPEPPC